MWRLVEEVLTGFVSQALASKNGLFTNDASPAVPGVELRVSEGETLPLPDGTVDAVFANMYLHHATIPARAVAEMASVLKPGGRLVITDLDRHDNH